MSSRLGNSAIRTYRKHEWHKRKALITRLYIDEKFTVDQLIAVLAKAEFHVNKRMIMTRVRQWGIARNSNFDEMCAAVRLLGDQELDEVPLDTAFLIRGQQVSLNKILVYFKRKEISDPVSFVKGVPEDRLTARDVQLCQPANQLESNSTQDCTVTPSLSGSWNASLIPGIFSSSTPNSAGCYGNSRSTSSTTRVDLAMISPHVPEISRMRSPTQNCERLIWSITVYVDSYNASDRYESHHEPAVHHLTTHGQFGARVQEWIAQMSRKGPQGKPDQVSASFNSALDLVSELLNDHSPMNIAQVLTVICELLQQKHVAMVKMLIRHFYNMSRVQGKAEHTIGAFCAALKESDDADLTTGMVTCVMQRALETLTRNRGRTDWRSLYLKERLCDALYYARDDRERQKIRKGLLADQVERHGPNARNVLWTMAIVADDLRLAGDFDEAEGLFSEVLQRAQGLEGYHRAKTRFPALEGLGLCYWDMALMITAGNRSHDGGWDEKRIGLLRQAVVQFRVAEEEARRWFVFPMATRRVERVGGSRRDVERLIELWG